MGQTSSRISNELDLSEHLTAKGQPAPFLEGLAEAYRTRVGWTMLTLLVFDQKRRVGRRVFTTDPVNYPVSSEKPMAESDWGDRVLKRREVFVANRPEEFKPHFVDWEKLVGMGMLSALNYPIVVDGEVLGTVNLTAGANFYSADRVEAGKALNPLAALGFLLIERGGQKGRL
jgi:hypothetical protein